MRNNYCLICNNKIPSSFILANRGICRNCFRQLPVVFNEFKIDDIHCLAIYKYTDFVEEIIVKIKGYGDIELAQCLLSPYKPYLSKIYKGYVLLPVPSSQLSNIKRGFNHVEEIFKILGLKIVPCFKKNSTYKQSNQNRFNRSNIGNVISIDISRLSPNEHYLLVDDITTTHNSLRTCIKLLKENNIKNIKVLVVAKRY